MQDGYPIRVDRRTFVEMADGVRVALTLYLPDALGDGPFPAVIESLPYRKDDDCTDRDWATFSTLASRGIAGVRVDIRGTGASTGVIENEYLAQEQADNLAVMAWVEAQDWCTGRLGMWGISWGGFSALQAAMLQPRQLGAIAAMHATHDRFACDVHYLGGSLHAAEQADWPGSMIPCNALPPDPDIVGEGWFEEWMKRLDATPQWPIEWLRHQTRDAYWLHGSPSVDYSSIACPTLLIGGWRDPYVDGMTALAEKLTCPTRLVVGPWGHHRPATGVPGPTMDHFTLLADWFGHHLRGDANHIMDDLPAATVFIHSEPSNDVGQVRGRWRSEPEWPPPDLDDVAMMLSGLDHGQTTWSGPQWVGSHAPAWDSSGVEIADSSTDDAFSMCFDSSPLDEQIEILGQPEMDLEVSSDRPLGLVAIRLLAVAPTGDIALITRGSRNLAFPENLSVPTPIEPGRPVRLRFSLVACSATIPSGWSLRVAIAGADFPVVLPPGETFELRINPEASRLILPTAPPRPADRWLEIDEATVQPDTIVEELDSHSERTVEHHNDRTTYRRSVRHSELQPSRADLVYSSEQAWSVEVDDDDPGSLSVTSVGSMGLARSGWDTGATGTLHLQASRDFIHLSIDLTARHNGETVFERQWSESIPREWA